MPNRYDIPADDEIQQSLKPPLISPPSGPSVSSLQQAAPIPSVRGLREACASTILYYRSYRRILRTSAKGQLTPKAKKTPLDRDLLTMKMEKDLAKDFQNHVYSCLFTGIYLFFPSLLVLSLSLSLSLSPYLKIAKTIVCKKKKKKIKKIKNRKGKKETKIGTLLLLLTTSDQHIADNIKMFKCPCLGPLFSRLISLSRVQSQIAFLRNPNPNPHLSFHPTPFFHPFTSRSFVASQLVL